MRRASSSLVSLGGRRAIRGIASSGAFPTTPCGLHPLIDVTPLLEPASDCLRSATAEHMGAALRQVGWFYAAGVSVLPSEYIRDIYAYLALAHALPVDVKYKYRQRAGLGSYSGPDVGEPELAYDGSPSRATVRGWDYSRSRFSLGVGEGTPLADRYPPPHVLSPPFVDTMDELYERQDKLGRALMSGLEQALQLPKDALLSQFDGGDFGTIRLLHYPAAESPPPELSRGTSTHLTNGISPHTDFEVFTLMHQDAPGLQFMRRAPDGARHHLEWTDAPVRPEEFVVTVGDCLERVTNGELLATPHRVLYEPRRQRNSIVRFNAFRPEAVVRPMAQFVSASRPPAYSPVTMATHMETTMRNLANGVGSWDSATQRSISATFDYSDLGV